MRISRAGTSKSSPRERLRLRLRLSRLFPLPNPQPRSGFTLIELVLVLFVIGLVLAVSFPKIAGLGRGDLRQTSRHLIRTVQILVDRAEATKKLYRLNYDLERQEYWATVLQPVSEEAGEFVPVNSALLKRVALPDPIRFKDVVTLRQGKITEGEAYTQFYSSGLVERTLFHITDEDQGESLTLIIQPLTGRVKVLEGYVEEH
jgi:general secretion pathway protein H